MQTGSAIWTEHRIDLPGGETKNVKVICEACRKLHLPRVEEVLARLRDGDATARAEAARELARHRYWNRDGGTARELRDALTREGRQSPVGREIIKALTALGGPEAESALIAELQKDGLDWSVRYSGDQPLDSEAEQILGALGRIGGSILIVRALCDTMMSLDLTYSTRAASADYLSDIAYRFTVGYGLTPTWYGRLTPADREFMIEPLLAGLCDESAGIRECAAAALGHLGDTRALQNLLDLLSDENQHVRYRTAEALGNLGDKRAVLTLKQTLKDDPGIAVPVREALAKLDKKTC
jgi:hypothetical protein